MIPAVMICVWLMAALAVPAAAQNLLRNGSFEGPVAVDVPESWSYHDFQGDAIASGTVDRGGRVGQASLKLTSPVFPVDFAAYCRPIDLTGVESNEIIFSCFFRTKEHPQAEVTLATYGEDFTVREFRTRELQSQSHTLGETPEWTLFTTHLRLRPGSKQLVVLLRVLGGGTVWYDGVSVREVGSELQVDLQDAGTIVELPGRRRVRAHIRNVSDREIPVHLNLEARQDRKRRRESSQCVLAPGQEREVETLYRFDFREPHTLFITVVGETPDEVHQGWRLDAPGLVDARIVEPAFRSMVLSTVPTDHVVVEGRLNATAEIARQAEISGHLVGTGERDPKPEFLTDDGVLGPWRLDISSEGMLTEQYLVNVTARVGEREHTLSLPIRRASHAEYEVAYDANHHLYIHGERVFPLGIHSVVHEEDLSGAVEAGFNFTITSSRSMSWRFANAARDVGMYVALASPALQGLFWQNMAETYIQHPALLGWYGIELPDLQAVTPQTLQQAYVESTTGPYPAIAQLDRHHPVILALRPNKSLEDYARAADVVLVWTEPIPRWPITAVSNAVRIAREGVDDHKPVWAIIQSTGHLWSAKLNPERDIVVDPPTPNQHRAMVYLALMAGADGLVYYAHSLPARGDQPSYRIMRDAPELWESIAETNAQVRTLAPVLMAGKARPIELEEDALEAAEWVHDGARYVAVVNTGDAEIATALDLNTHQTVEVMFENREAVPTDAGQIGDIFEPYATHVYRLSD